MMALEVHKVKFIYFHIFRQRWNVRTSFRILLLSVLPLGWFPTWSHGGKGNCPHLALVCIQVNSKQLWAIECECCSDQTIDGTNVIKEAASCKHHIMIYDYDLCPSSYNCLLHSVWDTNYYPRECRNRKTPHHTASSSGEEKWLRRSHRLRPFTFLFIWWADGAWHLFVATCFIYSWIKHSWIRQPAPSQYCEALDLFITRTP